MDENTIPRELTGFEKELLFSVLPENKPGYKLYREKINSLVITAPGRFNGGNLILGKPGSVPDLSSSSAPVFAISSVIYKDNQADIIIHEEIEDEIEIDISFSKEPPGDLIELRRWSYSDWVPGENAPADNSEIREVEIIKEYFRLAIAPVHKKIWLHSYASGVNMLIPVTNFYNYLMMVKNIRSADLVFKPALLFSGLNNYKDEDLRSAFFAYNKYFKRVQIDYTRVHPVQPARVGNKLNLFNLFKRG